MSDRVRLHPGVHALSSEMAIEDLKGRDHGHGVVNGPTKEVDEK